MKWATRKHVKVDRVACYWPITSFPNPDPESPFPAEDGVLSVAEKKKAIPFDVRGVDLGRHGIECSFDAILKRYGLNNDPALVLLAKIVNGADTDNSLWNQPESSGLKAIAEGFRQLGFKNDHELIDAEWIVYDALYGYWQEMVSRGKPNGVFR